MRDAVLEVFQLIGCGQFAVQKQIAYFEKVRFFGKLINRIAAVQKLALLTINKGDRRIARRGRGKAGVIGEHIALTIELANIDHVGSHSGRQHRQLKLFVTEGKFRNFLFIRHIFHDPFPFLT